MSLFTGLRRSVCVAALTALITPFTFAQDKQIKVGVIYDYTGPFAAGGSEASAIGTQIAIDMINEQGGVEGYKIVPVIADAQSKAEVAINEAERLLNQENVDLLMGVYSSAHCVPMAAKVDAAQKFVEFLLSPKAQQYFADNDYEYPVTADAQPDEALPALSTLKAPDVDLSDLGDLRGSLAMMREVGILR